MLKESIYACNSEKSRQIVAKLAPYVDLIGAIETLCKKYTFKSALITVCFGSLAKVGFESISEDRSNSLGAKLRVLSIFLCKIFIGQFFEERQVLAHFSYGA